LQRRDRLQITLPALPPEQTRELLRLIREAAGREPEVRHPSLNLERFFLDVVRRADGVADAGASEAERPS